ncbi:MAG: hypothetical protein A2219_08240 [Elusimicrobia bacterium RIFOXYA2_FULL_50_26]|nr:MAG: hypothetical protein A2219_08240 [Elusimicrobia bacterium RIFOXYA2_FULL_50_26]OGS25309.1 MAG: hypothetical protein A2314_00845 [Elusimicrobia bacterium RIFOXYB2_FULL_50_12]
MALEYTLRIGTDLVPVQLLELISGVAGMLPEGESLSAPGLVSVSAFTEKPLGRSVIEDNFQFTPTAFLLFRLDKFEDTEHGVLLTLRSSIKILNNSAADAVLLFNGEDVVFARLKGKLILNSSWDFWLPERLSEITLPHEMGEIRSL